MISVIVRNPRPDFRVFVDLLFGFGRNVDSEGDACPVFNRSWRYLYIKDRASSQPHVELYAEKGNPLQFEITSESTRLEELVALYLYVYCGDSISMDGYVMLDSEINALKVKYSVELKRAKDSVWHNSNESNPYPNIT